MYCEDPNFVISVTYKIQFGSKVNQLLLGLDTSSSVIFKKLLGLLTQLQQDTKGNIMDILLLLPSCGWCVNSFYFIFIFSFSFFFSFSGCGFKISFSIHGCSGGYCLAKWFWHVIRKDFVDITIYRVCPVKILIRKEGIVGCIKLVTLL